MKWYIMTDLEGACRVERWVQCDGSELHYERLEARRFITAEANATAPGIIDADPDADIVLWDGHGPGCIDPSLLDPRVSFIPHGWRIPAPFGLTSEFAGAFVLGTHSRAGTSNGCLAHTMADNVIGYWLNGREIGELAGRMAMAGGLPDGPVPVLLVSGCNFACAEAHDLVPEVLTVETKLSLAPERAQHRPPATVHAELRAQAAAAVHARDDIPPFVVPAPYTVRAKLTEGSSLDCYLRHPHTTRIDEQTAEQVTANLYETWI